jgi:hypothetical protein
MKDIFHSLSGGGLLAKGQYTAETNPAVSEKRRLYYAFNRELLKERARRFRGTAEGKAKTREDNARRRRNMSPEQREAQRAYMRNYAQSRKELVKQRRRDNPDPHRLSKKKSRLKKFGMTMEQWQDMFSKQGDGCAICSVGDTGNGRDWHLDHDHKTGKVRGILCHGCNTGLGGFKDSEQFLLAAITYLRSVQEG